MEDIILKIVECIISIAIIVLCRYAIPFIKSKIGAEKYNLAISYVTAVVAAMQQTLTDNNIKKETAVEKVREFLAEKGISLTEEQIDTLIEGAVKNLKLEEANSKTK